MRLIAAIGLAALAASCAQTATRLAQDTDETEAAASAAQTAKPAVRSARSSPFRAQTVSAHYQGNADARNNLVLPALRGQPDIAAPAGSVALAGTTQRDGEIATQAARAADRAAEQALDPAQEVALRPAREMVLSPTRETAREMVLSPIRETALRPARETAMSPAPETGSNQGFLQASACIRNNMKAAYRSSETVDQATSFLMRMCFAPFSSAVASDEASAKTLFRGLVFQEISPVEWLQALEESPAKGR
jgi:hypothetical protein